MAPQLSDMLLDLGLPNEVMDGWECRVAQVNGVDSVIFLKKNCEVHMASLTDRKAISRKNVREFVAPIVAEFGYASTRFPLAAIDKKLMRALGFVHSYNDDKYSYWVTTETPFSKAPK